MSKKSDLEIERKFLIRMPDTELLERMGDKTEIVQTYLKSEKGSTARVRKRGKNGSYIYTHTVKVRLSDMRRIEREREIELDEYQQLLNLADPQMTVIFKDRYTIDYMGQLLEIDVYPFYTDRAILEIELESEEQPIHIPPWLELVREVTADRRYTNAAMARLIPYDNI